MKRSIHDARQLEALEAMNAKIAYMERAICAIVEVTGAKVESVEDFAARLAYETEEAGKKAAKETSKEAAKQAKAEAKKAEADAKQAVEVAANLAELRKKKAEADAAEQAARVEEIEARKKGKVLVRRKDRNLA